MVGLCANGVIRRWCFSTSPLCVRLEDVRWPIYGAEGPHAEQWLKCVPILAPRPCLPSRRFLRGEQMDLAENLEEIWIVRRQQGA